MRASDGVHGVVKRGGERDEIATVSNFGAAHGGRGGCDAHDAVRAVHAVAEVTERDETPESTRAVPHLMKHNRHGDESL